MPCEKCRKAIIEWKKEYKYIVSMENFLCEKCKDEWEEYLRDSKMKINYAIRTAYGYIDR